MWKTREPKWAKLEARYGESAAKAASGERGRRMPGLAQSPRWRQLAQDRARPSTFSSASWACPPSWPASWRPAA